ncbi:MAG: site-2 protease family protein [Clostridium sp.]
MRNGLLGIIFTIPAVLIAFTAQGYAKAKMADMLGDKTPRFQGRVSLNPIDQIDLMGFIMIVICGFGWTKPLNTNPNAYKRGYKDAIKVTLAGPFANLLVGFIGSFVFLIFINFFRAIVPDSAFMVASNMLKAIVTVNISLFIFNLLPLPGLAGFDIMKNLWPKTFYKVADTIYQYQMFILIGVVIGGQYILGIPVSIIYNLFINIAGLVIGIFL